MCLDTNEHCLSHVAKGTFPDDKTAKCLDLFNVLDWDVHWASSGLGSQLTWTLPFG